MMGFHERMSLLSKKGFSDVFIHGRHKMDSAIYLGTSGIIQDTSVLSYWYKIH